MQSEQSYWDRQHIASKAQSYAAQSFSDRGHIASKNMQSYAQSFSDRQYITLKDAPSYDESFSDKQYLTLKNAQSFWEGRQIIYSDVAIVISQALNYEKPNESFSSVLLYAHFTKLLGQSHQQGFSLLQCLRLCNSKELYFYDANVLPVYGLYSQKQLMEFYENLQSNFRTRNEMKMPDVEAVKVFEDIKVLNEILENPGLLVPLMTPKTAPTKFEMVQESLKNGNIMVKMKSEEFIITDYFSDGLISDEKETISREEFNKNATEACFADDFQMIIFQDFSVKNNFAPSKADLIIEVLNEKKKPVMVGMRINGFLRCVLIVGSDKDSLFARRWTEGRVDSFSIRFDYFNENAIEAYFFDSPEAAETERDYIVCGRRETTNRPKYRTNAAGGNQKSRKTTETRGNQTHRETTETGENEEEENTEEGGNQNPVKTTETGENNPYYDSVIFKNIEEMQYRFNTGDSYAPPELIFNSKFEVVELEVTKSLEKSVKIEIGVSYPPGLQVTGGLDATLGVTRRVVYKIIEDTNDKKPILVSYVENANPSNPSNLKYWGLMVTNQTPDDLLPKLTAMSFHIMESGYIREQTFQRIDFLIKFWKPKIFHKDCSNKKALKRLACKEGEIPGNEYEIKSKQLIKIEEWPGCANYQGFLICFKFVTVGAKRLYCGLIRAASADAEERLILEFSRIAR